MSVASSDARRWATRLVEWRDVVDVVLVVCSWWEGCDLWDAVDEDIWGVWLALLVFGCWCNGQM